MGLVRVFGGGSFYPRVRAGTFSVSLRPSCLAVNDSVPVLNHTGDQPSATAQAACGSRCPGKARFAVLRLAGYAGSVEAKRYVLGTMFGDNPQILLDHVPHCRELRMVALYARPAEFALKIPYDATLVGDPARGVVFGGVITTLLDHAGGVAVMCALEEARGVATIDLRIDYMRPATPGRDLLGFAHCYRVTRNVAFVSGAAYHDHPDDPFARFQSTYMLGATPIASMERVAEWVGQEGAVRGEESEGPT